MKQTINRKNLIIVFLVCFLYNFLSFLRAYYLRLYPDDIGVLMGAAHLAGLNWSGISDFVGYYGQAYYIIFTPLFLITNNPYIIFITIQLVSVVLTGLTGVIIYRCSVLYFRLNDDIYTILLSALCTTFISVAPGTLSNEIALQPVVWVICLLLMRLFNEEKRKKRIALTILLVIALSFSLLLHTRFIALVLVIAVVAVLFFLLFRKWVVEPLVFYPLIVFGYIGTEWIKNTLTNLLWGGKVASEVLNASMDVFLDVSRITSIYTIIRVIISNIYTLIIATHGIAAVVLVLAASLLFQIVKNIRKDRKGKRMEIPLEQLFVFIVFGLCIIGTILGLTMMWGRGIENGIAQGVVTNSMRGLIYTRYYFIYFSPLLITLYSYCQKNSKKIAKYCVTANILFLAISIYIMLFLAPHIGAYSENYSHPVLPLSGMTSTVAWTVLMLGMYWLLLSEFTKSYSKIGIFHWWQRAIRIVKLVFRDSRKKLPFLLILIWLFIIRIGNVSWPFFSVSARSPGLDATYTLLHYIEDTVPLPIDIYTQSLSPYNIQYMFSQHRTIVGLPEATVEGDSLYVGNNPTEEEFTDLTALGYRYYWIDNGMTVWVKGETIHEAIKKYAKSYDAENNIMLPEIISVIDKLDADQIHISGIDGQWIYQALFPEKIIANFPEAGLDSPRVLSVVKPNVKLMLFPHLIYKDYAIITQDQAIWDAVISIGGIPGQVTHNIPLSSMFLTNGTTPDLYAYIAPDETLYGPYICMPHGGYNITIYGCDVNMGNILFTDEYGEIQFKHIITCTQKDFVTMEVILPKSARDFEIVLINNSDTDIIVSCISIESVT